MVTLIIRLKETLVNSGQLLATTYYKYIQISRSNFKKSIQSMAYTCLLYILGY